ncbi:MAG: endonuclease III [Candidatus Omnitrophica bacterium]|nr:endonuclease III [Candidatus Omnitrophota bacterium]
MTNKNISSAIKALRQALKDYPDPSVTLVGKQWQDPFHVLISCLLSLRTKDETTLPASKRLFALGHKPRDFLDLSEQKIAKTIYPVGFYRTKAAVIKGVCRDLVEKFKGQVPDDIDTLLTLKGVGRKTANLVLIEGFQKPAMCVDTHVHRISNRWGYIQTKNPTETEEALRKKLPKRFWIDYNALLVSWGQNVCKPVSPWCSKCPLKRMCGQVNVGTRR